MWKRPSWLFLQWNFDIPESQWIGKICSVWRTILFSTPVIVLYMKRKPDITRPRYGKHVLPFPWFCHSLVMSRFFSPFFTTVEPPVTATSLQWPFFFVPADSPYIDTCLNLSTTATPTKARPQLTAKINCRQRPVFLDTDEKVKNGRDIWSVWRVDV